MKEMLSQLMNDLSQFDVVSFDVLDTLLLRCYLNQSDMWRDFGRRQTGADGEDFCRARISADKNSDTLAVRRGGEHTIAEAYSMMPKRYSALREKEESFQRNCLEVNPEVFAIWQRAGALGKKRVIVSDMYLDEDWFKKTLSEMGLGDYDGLYVSSAYQARKVTGKLFEIVKHDFQGLRILHIGDNVDSDVRQAEAVGIAARHYRNIREVAFDECKFLRYFLSEYPTFEKRLVAGRMILDWHLFKCRNAKVSYWMKLGFYFGGMLGSLYVNWIAKTAHDNGIDHLMFVARDGYLWKQMLDRMGTDIKSDYFYAPRMMAVKVCGAVSGIDKFSNADKERFVNSLGSYDKDSVRKRYTEYLSQFEIDDRTAIVDGWSSAFTVQTFVETIVGHGVKTMYLTSISPVRNGFALFPREVPHSSWIGLSEFLFSSTEGPIVDVGVCGPTYVVDIPAEECFRASVFPEIATGALAGFDSLQKMPDTYLVSRQDWLDLLFALQYHMTDEDIGMLSTAQISWNLRQDNFHPVMEPRQENRRVVRRLTLPIGLWRGRVTPEAYVETLYLFGRYSVMARKFNF